MLTPENPSKGDPRYREKLARFKKDREHKKAHPEEWGVLRPVVDAEERDTHDAKSDQ